MCKFTTIILLFSIFCGVSTEIKAQNADVALLKEAYNNSGTIGFSRGISYTTTITAFGVPVVMGTVALIKNDEDLFRNAIYTTAALGLNSVLTYSIKHSINRDRPYITYPFDFERRDAYSGASPSFPSGHTSLAFATATSLSLQYPKWYVIAPSYLWAGYVGYSRMNLGVHYPSDVLAGAILGAGSAFVTYKINEWYWKKHENTKLLPLRNYFR